MYHLARRFLYNTPARELFLKYSKIAICFHRQKHFGRFNFVVCLLCVRGEIKKYRDQNYMCAKNNRIGNIHTSDKTRDNTQLRYSSRELILTVSNKRKFIEIRYFFCVYRFFHVE